MKRIITIFLLLLSIAYMIPLSAMGNKETTHFILDIDDEKEDNNKKEKKSEVIVAVRFSYVTNISKKSNYKITSCILPSLFHTIETPPPDLA